MAGSNPKRSVSEGFVPFLSVYSSEFLDADNQGHVTGRADPPVQLLVRLLKMPTRTRRMFVGKQPQSTDN